MARRTIGSDKDDPLAAGARAVARTLRRSSLDPDHIAAVAMLIDAAALGLGLWVAAYASSSLDFDPAQAAINATLKAVIATIVLHVCGMYNLAALRQFSRGGAALLVFGLVLAAAETAVFEGSSRL